MGDAYQNSPEHLPEGLILFDKYRVGKPLASGGQAWIYHGEHIHLDRRVAIKVLKGHIGPDDPMRTRDRFEREAKLLSKLRDPNTMTLFDYGMIFSGNLVMITEYIDGVTLKQLLVERGKLDEASTLYIGRRILESLEEAHGLGIIHRDIKPTNVMVYTFAGRSNQIKVLDFGIARISEEALFKDEFVEELTMDGTVVGTPFYMAPELLRGANATPSSDLYSLGLVLRELLAGADRSKTDNIDYAIARQLDPVPLSLPDRVLVSTRTRDVINKLLEKDLSRRFATAGDVLRALDGLDDPAFDPERTTEIDTALLVGVKTKTYNADKLASLLDASSPPSDTPSDDQTEVDFPNPQQDNDPTQTLPLGHIERLERADRAGVRTIIPQFIDHSDD